MTSYYNENDPNAAAWLRNLIKAGELPDGRVDERSIVDVRGSDLDGFDQCHFFAGIGGWPYALRLAGWPDNRPVWTGSCPCQPLSSAGQRKGHADQRHLWPAFQRLIAKRRPPVVFGEQVASKDGREWLAAVRADLESLGYAVGAASLPAGGFGAPHIRYRLFFVADADDERSQGVWADGHALGRQGPDLGSLGLCSRTGAGGMADAGCGASQRDTGSVFAAQAERSGEDGALDGHLSDRHSDGGATGGLADTAGAGERRNLTGGMGADQRFAESTQPEFGRETEGNFSGGATGGLADTEHAERGALDLDREDGRDGEDGGRAEAYGKPRTRGEVRGLADAAGGGRGARLGHANARGDELHHEGRGETGRPRASDSFWADADWICCRDGKWRPVESGSQPLAHGVPARLGRLRGYGNAIVPQVAQAFIEAWLSLGGEEEQRQWRIARNLEGTFPQPNQTEMDLQPETPSSITPS